MKNVFILFIVLSFYSCNDKVDYYHLPLYSSNSNLNAVIEIPAGTNFKYEYNKGTKIFEVDQKNGKDRVIQYLPYIGNYGFLPSTYSDPKKGGDGDALDVLVLSESNPIGTVIEIIPIGVLKLIDDGELDYKIIAVPVDKSKRVINVKTLEEFSIKYPYVKQMIEFWFLNYNKDDDAQINGWGDEKEAKDEIKLWAVNENNY